MVLPRKQSVSEGQSTDYLRYSDSGGIFWFDSAVDRTNGVRFQPVQRWKNLSMSFLFFQLLGILQENFAYYNRSREAGSNGFYRMSIGQRVFNYDQLTF